MGPRAGSQATGRPSTKTPVRLCVGRPPRLAGLSLSAPSTRGRRNEASERGKVSERRCQSRHTREGVREKVSVPAYVRREKVSVPAYVQNFAGLVAASATHSYFAGASAVWQRVMIDN